MLAPTFCTVLADVQKVKLMDSVYGVQIVALLIIGAMGCTALIVGGSVAEALVVALAGGMGTIIGVLFKNKVTEVN